MRSAERLWAIVSFACVVALVAGCNAPTAGGNTTGHTSVSPSPAVRTSPVPIGQAPADVAAKWQDLDATVVPPPGYGLSVQLTQEVINHTGGRVDDATARRWASDYLRADNWSAWGTRNLQVDGFFRHLAPPDPISQAAVFGDEFGAMKKALKAGASLDVQFLSVTRLTLVPVSPGVQDALLKTYGYPDPVPGYAFVVDARGPSSLVLVYPDGHKQTVVEFPATQRDRAFIVGEPKDMPGTLGEIWVAHTYLSCPSSDFLRANCAA